MCWLTLLQPQQTPAQTVTVFDCLVCTFLLYILPPNVAQCLTLKQSTIWNPVKYQNLLPMFGGRKDDLLQLPCSHTHPADGVLPTNQRFPYNSWPLYITGRSWPCIRNVKEISEVWCEHQLLQKVCTSFTQTDIHFYRIVTPLNGEMWQLLNWSLNSLLLQNPKIQYHVHTNMPLNSIFS